MVSFFLLFSGEGICKGVTQICILLTQNILSKTDYVVTSPVYGSLVDYFYAVSTFRQRSLSDIKY